MNNQAHNYVSGFSRSTMNHQYWPHKIWPHTTWLFCTLFTFLLVSCGGQQQSNSDGNSNGGAWYRVRSGDTISHIAQKYRVSQESIINANRIRNDRRLYIDKKIFIPNANPILKTDGLWYQVRRGDTVSEIAVSHKTTVGKLVLANNLQSADHLPAGQKILIPDQSNIHFRNPMKIPLVVTSKYGYRKHPISRMRKFHHGIDFRARKGTRTYACRDGKVVRAGWDPGYGNIVVVEHSGGYKTAYGHLSIIYVKVGQKVKKGHVLALTGNSGYSTGPHLHFEIRRYNKSVDPRRYIKLGS